MAAVARYLADTSALARLHHPEVAAVLAPLIESVAEREHVTVLHYDGDYELIAHVTARPVRWVIPRGTLP
jgi:predicted nucleic acid-binding protein